MTGGRGWRDRVMVGLIMEEEEESYMLFLTLTLYHHKVTRGSASLCFTSYTFLRYQLMHAFFFSSAGLRMIFHIRITFKCFQTFMNFFFSVDHKWRYSILRTVGNYNNWLYREAITWMSMVYQFSTFFLTSVKQKKHRYGYSGELSVCWYLLQSLSCRNTFVHQKTVQHIIGYKLYSISLVMPFVSCLSSAIKHNYFKICLVETKKRF